MTAKTKQVKYIFVTGGVVSSLGKGIASASLGLLLKRSSIQVSQKVFGVIYHRRL